MGFTLYSIYAKLHDHDSQIFLHESERANNTYLVYRRQKPLASFIISSSDMLENLK